MLLRSAAGAAAGNTRWYVGPSERLADCSRSDNLLESAWGSPAGAPDLESYAGWWEVSPTDSNSWMLAPSGYSVVGWGGAAVVACPTNRRRVAMSTEPAVAMIAANRTRCIMYAW